LDVCGFYNTADIMIINGKEITALGNPPFNPVYSSWSDCWASFPRYRMLQAHRLFSRPYLAPAFLQPVEGFRYIGPTKFPEQGHSAPWILQKYFEAFGSPFDPKWPKISALIGSPSPFEPKWPKISSSPC